MELTRSTVSEVLRIFMESHGYDTEVCNTMRTKPFHTLPPDTKAAILGFLVEELNSSNIVTRLAQIIYSVAVSLTEKLLLSHFEDLFINVFILYFSDIDNTLENMATYRKNKWIIEGKLRK